MIWKNANISSHHSLQRALAEHTGEGCLLWVGAQTWAGYGTLRANGKNYRAHRLAYEETYGSLLGGDIVRHSCDVRLCFNPRHLLLGTQADNMKDKVERGRVKCGEDIIQSKLKEGDIPFIRMVKGLITQLRLGEMFNVNRSTISQIQGG